MLSDSYIKATYGNPGDINNLTTIALPYPMRIAWDKKTKVTKISCHKKIADPLLNVFNDLLLHYGYQKLVELGIDLFGGCYNFRQMRGGTKWSRHSWAIAVDLDPERNGLKVKWKDSQFSKPEYKFMIDTFYKYGFINLGKEKDYDSMHFEFNQ